MGCFGKFWRKKRADNQAYNDTTMKSNASIGNTIVKNPSAEVRLAEKGRGVSRTVTGGKGWSRSTGGGRGGRSSDGCSKFDIELLVYCYSLLHMSFNMF
ncbi:hypothetical protein JRO89_XS12G0050900 [Xanthoceras sorbifolium]|uniref:Uncharacterized protein n=1 Tax=Xanthoceras sorbifolium TaxID=99658 RepID=A0ABQ8HB78_9ROSI|nr:hypothetical protein JRO89_XS12G0050900 [Xanthoceras sorbifolium]